MSHVDSLTRELTEVIAVPPAATQPLRIAHWLDARVGRTELRRRVWHMLPGVLSFGLWLFPHRDPISPTLKIILASLTLVLALKIFVGFRSIQRFGEADRQATWAVIGYGASVLICLLLFPGQAEIALGVLGILAFGDGTATLGGLLLRGPALPWNHHKRWSGLASFVVFGTLMAAVMYWGESHNLEARTPGVTFAVALQCALVASLVAALAESWPSRINDNIRVGIAASASMAVTHGLFVGWAG